MVKRTIPKNSNKEQRKSKTKKAATGSGRNAFGKPKRRGRQELAAAIAAIFRDQPNEVFNYKQVSYLLGATTMSEKANISALLDELLEDSLLKRVDRGRYRLNDTSSVSIGVFERRSNGRNSVRLEGEQETIFVAERNSGHALDGDKVRVELHAVRRGREAEASVIEVIERAKQTLVGRMQITDTYSFLVTEDRTMSNDIFIAKGKLNGAQDGDKVVARIVAWPDSAKNPQGEVLAVLGKSGENDTEMNAILAEYGLPYEYPEEVEMAARKITSDISASDIAKREDFRQILTLTIDPEDAKDFDDALSYQQLPNGLFEVGVHIADVSHYVEEGDTIDREAYERATSIYLVDRTIPMLPERLSNDLCSLKPNLDRLAYSCIFTLNESAQVQNYRITRTIIRSDRRFSYEEAQKIIETGEGDCKDAVLKLNELAQHLRKHRFDAGAIDFDRKEVGFDLDDRGYPIGVKIKESKEANKLIEEFMLLANRSVAASIGKVPEGKKARPFVYRIHEQPDPEKLENLGAFVRRFGLKFKGEGTNQELSRSINRLLTAVKGKPEQNIVETIAIRSMSRAVYSTNNIGHYGLSFDYYSHFTSPIRRYPDLLVHRLLTRYLSGGSSVDKEHYEALCVHCSEMEQIAANAERASIKYKQVEYMSTRIGKVYDGVISGVTEWGLYVELNESHCEGLVPIRFLDDDYYEYDDVNYRLVGRRNNRQYSLGDLITVRVASANLERKQLDFEPLS